MAADLTHTLSRRDARRIAVRAQLLDRPRPTDLSEVARRLCTIQVDPTAAVARSADLVLWSRLGGAYDRSDLVLALEARQIVEFRGFLRPGEDMALHGAEMAAWPGAGTLRPWEVAQREWVSANDACRRDILFRLDATGPQTSREIPDTCAVPWRSSGWTDHRNVTQLLELMVRRGEVAVAGRRGQERLWDLAERVYPDHPIAALEEAQRQRRVRRLVSLGLARAQAAEMPGEPVDVGEVGERAVVEGVRGHWRVDPEQLGQPFTGRAALLSPLDRLLHDRKRMTELFEFDYALEMFKPAAKRRWGYYALPVLYGDRLVGKLDATADHDAGVLRVHALHWDEPPSSAATRAVAHEIDALAAWMGLAVRRE